jgi:hypothetical protein
MMTAMRSPVRRCCCRFAILIIVTVAGFAILAISQRGLAMVGGAPTAATDFGRSVVMILGSSGTACTYKLVGSEPGQPPILKAVVRIERHPQFDMQRLLGHLATADVALIKLAESLPAPIPLAGIGGKTETIKVGDTLVVAGYGVTVRGDGRTGGTVRAAPLIVTGQPGSLQIRLFDPVSKGLTAGLGACAGDSGAPAFAGSGKDLRIIGVVSWSTGPNLTVGCGGLTGITPLLRYRGWIVDTARKLGTPLAP